MVGDIEGDILEKDSKEIRAKPIEVIETVDPSVMDEGAEDVLHNKNIQNAFNKDSSKIGVKSAKIPKLARDFFKSMVFLKIGQTLQGEVCHSPKGSW